MTGPRADWPATTPPTYRQIADLLPDRRTVAGMWWYAAIEWWSPEQHTADITVYEYPTEQPTSDGRQVWGCVLSDVASAEDLLAAASARLKPTAYELIGDWTRDGDRWLARVAVEHLP